jgi:hypothetical protein
MINKEIQTTDSSIAGLRESYHKGPAQPAGDSVINLKDKFTAGEREDLSLIPRSLPDGKGGLAEVADVKAMWDPDSVKDVPRKMSEREKRDFKSWFPNLDVENTVVSGEATPEYNCIAWTVGETHEWCWPPQMYPFMPEREAFDRFYGSYGFKPAEQGEVARWRNEDGLTHGCVSGPDHGPTWESKCGAELKIQHALKELESDVYGWVEGYYTREGGPAKMPKRKPVEIPMSVKTSLKKSAEKISPQIREKFDENYSQWLEFRKDPKLHLSSNPADYCKTEAFGSIVKQGPSVLPLLVNKMAGGDFFCIQAVNTIKEENKYSIMGAGDPIRKGMARMTLSPEEMENSEQNKAALMVLKWSETQGI